MLKSILPNIYLKWFPNTLLNFKIEEKKATCENCALSQGKSPDKRSYLPDLKCCTFQPFQTNYLLGQILNSPKTPMKVLERIQLKMEQFEYVLPIGIVASISNQVQFVKRKSTDFGNRRDWLCPYYDVLKNNCGIWKSRSSVCTSFHCLSSYGAIGFEFWDKLSDYISYIEMALMEEAMLKLDFTPNEISEQVGFLNRTKLFYKEKPAPFLSEEFSRKIWKGYFGEEVIFYKRCYDIVSNFSSYQFKKALGETGIALQKKVMTAKKAVLL